MLLCGLAAQRARRRATRALHRRLAVRQGPRAADLAPAPPRRARAVRVEDRARRIARHLSPAWVGHPAASGEVARRPCQGGVGPVRAAAAPLQGRRRVAPAARAEALRVRRVRLLCPLPPHQPHTLRRARPRRGLRHAAASPPQPPRPSPAALVFSQARSSTRRCPVCSSRSPASRRTSSSASQSSAPSRSPSRSRATSRTPRPTPRTRPTSPVSCRPTGTTSCSSSSLQSPSPSSRPASRCWFGRSRRRGWWPRASPSPSRERPSRTRGRTSRPSTTPPSTPRTSCSSSRDTPLSFAPCSRARCRSRRRRCTCCTAG
mmetsp:Transcript_11422/g.38073  ORF Transcript_11422/g.38073 Transcript_11422/m.38073 type:complete len:318 (+) Transcript_11422:374-1327(+)